MYKPFANFGLAGRQLGRPHLAAYLACLRRAQQAAKQQKTDEETAREVEEEEEEEREKDTMAMPSANVTNIGIHSSLG